MSLASEIEKIKSRVEAVRREFEEKVRDNETKSNRLDQSEFDAYHSLREELAQFEATVGETETRASADRDFLNAMTERFNSNDSFKIIADNWRKKFPNDPLVRIEVKFNGPEITDLILITKSGRVSDNESSSRAMERMKRS